MAEYRGDDWGPRMMMFLRSLTPQEVDAAAATLGEKRGDFLALWREAHRLTVDEEARKQRSTEGKELLGQAWNWLTKLTGTRRGTVWVHVRVHGKKIAR